MYAIRSYYVWLHKGNAYWFDNINDAITEYHKANGIKPGHKGLATK